MLNNVHLPPSYVSLLGDEEIDGFTRAYHHNFRIVEIACFLNESYVWDDCSNALLEIAHFEKHVSSPLAENLDWLFLSSMVIHCLGKDMKRDAFCQMVVNLRNRINPASFKGVAFVLFEHEHCTSYVYHAASGTFRDADSLGRMPSQTALPLLLFFLRDLKLSLPTACVNARVNLQGKCSVSWLSTYIAYAFSVVGLATGSCNIVARNFIDMEVGKVG